VGEPTRTTLRMLAAALRETVAIAWWAKRVRQCNACRVAGTSRDARQRCGVEYS
jgi:hypothetical protein